MGFNPRFRMWSNADWQGYCPTIGDMARREWSLTARCNRCDLRMAVDIAVVIRRTGQTWSPWGRTARCRRLYCGGRMHLRAYAPRAGEYVDL
jgi:hypothetical protein